eukprot:2614706-Rhodomonas_salina.2
MGVKKKKSRFRGYSVPDAETVMLENSKTGVLMKVFLFAQVLFAVGLAVRSPGTATTRTQSDVDNVLWDGLARESITPPSNEARRIRASALQDRPVIGIVTQPLFTDSDEDAFSHMDERPPYLAASYVKLVEAAGARPAVIFHNSSDAELKAIFQRVNAVLFPGGRGGPKGKMDGDAAYLKVGKKIIQMAESANEAGDYFSLHFTCLGFEVLVSTIAGSCDILQPTDAENLRSSLKLDWGAVRASRMFASRGVVNGTAYAELLEGEEPLTMNFHAWGLYLQDFVSNTVLRSYLRVLSTSTDAQGREYVSTVEARKYPFFGTQWHPEKNAFEWTPSQKIPHSPDAVAVTSFFAQLLGAEARESAHVFGSEEEVNAALVYNWAPTFTAKEGWGALQTPSFSHTPALAPQAKGLPRPFAVESCVSASESLSLRSAHRVTKPSLCSPELGHSSAARSDSGHGLPLPSHEPESRSRS